MSMPKVIFDDWKHPSVDGWPPEWEWCMVIWGVDADATPDVFVGGYSEEKKAFYANFGMGGAVLDREQVIAWTLLSEHRWEGVEAKPSVELRPSAGGKDCPANGEHEGIECQCDECDYAMICFPPEQMDERLRRVVCGK